MSLHDPSWQYIPAAAHSDASKFRERQQERVQRAAQKCGAGTPARSTRMELSKGMSNGGCDLPRQQLPVDSRPPHTEARA